MLTMVLWFLLGVSTVVAFATVALTGANAAAAAEVNEIWRKHGLSGGLAGCLWLLASMAGVALWTVYAVQQGDWRIAAIVWLPALATWISKAARRKAKPKPKTWEDLQPTLQRLRDARRPTT